jgi:hypothetical protein
MIRKEYGLNMFGKSSEVNNYRTLNGAVDRAMRDARIIK